MRITFQNASENHTDMIQTGVRRPETGAGTTVSKNEAVCVDRGGSLFADGRGRHGKAASVSDIRTGAAATDAAVLQDYMTVMSHTLSEEDYQKLQEEGFDLKNADPEKAVTIVDRIKAELVRSGQHIEGYTDDVDLETLTEVLGSQVLAEAVCRSFAQADVPMTEERVSETAEAWDMLSQIEEPDDGAYYYMIDNGMDPEIRNFYLAQSSGTRQEAPRQARYYEEEVQGYYSRNVRDGEGEEPAVFEVDEKLQAQMDKVIEQAGLPVTEESREAARWLFEQKLPVTEENIRQYEKLTEVEFPVTEERFAKAAAGAASEGKHPMRADLAETDTVYEKAVKLLERYRNVEEVRLHMTAEVNVRLLRSGFAIDTAPIEKVIEAVKQAEREIAEQYFPSDAQAVEKYREWNEVDGVVSELPELPVRLIGMRDVQDVPEEGAPEAGQPASTADETLGDFYGKGKALQQQYEQAGERYEALMTAPRADMGDSLKKAFANIDDILRDLGYDATEENRRLARILGYNRMEMSVENLEKVREADRQVREVIEKMTPASVLKMIRDEVNPLEKSFAQLNEYFDSRPRDYEENAESYSRFLYRLERRADITPEERESYIGIFRLIHQIEKADSAVVGAVVNTQAQLQFSNLLSAARSGKFKSLDVRVTDELGTLSGLVEKGESISGQIAKGFSEAADAFLREVSYSEEAEQAYRQMEWEECRTAAEAEAEVTELLERGQMPCTAENLLAASALLKETSDPYGKLREKLESQCRSLERVWEKLEDKEDFQEECGQALEEAREAVEKAGLAEHLTSVDVREFRLMHKQLHVAAGLSRNEEYILPMDLEGQQVKVHLTIRRGQEEKGLVDIAVDFSETQRMEAKLQLKEGKVSGYLLGNSTDEVMKLQRTVDIFSDRIRDDDFFSMDAQLSVLDAADRTGNGARTAGRNGSLTAQRTRTAAGETGVSEPADNVALYRLAGMFLRSAKTAAAEV